MNRDRGSATVWAAMAATALCVVFATILALGQAVAARHRAGAAADLAALAAAGYALRGPEAACARAAEIAGAQDARVVRCAVVGEIADVTARAAFGPYAPTVRSRAGPPDALPARAPSAGPPPTAAPDPGPVRPASRTPPSRTPPDRAPGS
ncbi:pilus assembly protein TadG-related protein [Streptomyces sp. NBC_01498]|uniref:Rv3654c family TadE-like protein n=1 Tax=Streptomyces sp. NBC_01498 TaxID=2975870 RepID=UPI002E7B5D16|nr:Rv3654c family TadE-like protein [Streptomyces sp. NBC_01498]WTL25464.1 pilus assembly protein TadG-related protein [Streptomyces sp. NBC_01498]